METYRQVRVGLFIGLLGLNTLSACVNTSKQLMNRLTSGAMPNHATGVANTPVWVPNNGERVRAISGINPNMGAVTANAIVNALQNGDTKWGDGVPQVANPMFLEDYIIQDLARNGYNLKTIKYWIEKGLNINAKDAFGYTILMRAIGKVSAEDIEWMVEIGADVNAQTQNGGTTLFFAVCKLRHTTTYTNTKASKAQAWKIYNSIVVLLQSGANPCIPTQHGNSAKSMAELYAQAGVPNVIKWMKKVLVAFSEKVKYLCLA